MSLNKYIGFLLIFSLSISVVSSQSSENRMMLDKVFIIGENESQYEALVSETKSNLYEVCDNSMESAFSVWQDMLINFSDYAEKENVDINGVKIWLNVFWNNDGSIQHIVFYPKMNSKNIDFANLKTLFASFSEEFELAHQNESSFAHYGQASFPVHPKRVSEE